jgi:hypothetical protein
MNTPEKIASIYFRLNGFFLLPQFTLFSGQQHIHVDLLGLRPPGGQEICEDKILPTDTSLFATISEIIKAPAKDTPLGIITEIKGNNTVEIPSASHINYAGNFFGASVSRVPISISTKYDSLSQVDGCVLIPLGHALQWVLYRFRWMDQNLSHLTKSGSWNWSEETLADLLYLQKIGFADLDMIVRDQLPPRE